MEKEPGTTSSLEQSHTHTVYAENEDDVLDHHKINVIVKIEPQEAVTLSETIPYNHLPKNYQHSRDTDGIAVKAERHIDDGAESREIIPSRSIKIAIRKHAKRTSVAHKCETSPITAPQVGQDIKPQCSVPELGAGCLRVKTERQ